MNDSQRNQIKRLRQDGYSYRRIAQSLGISENTIKTYCRRQGLGGVVSTTKATDGIRFCTNCGAAVIQTAGRKEKKFCSDKCRMS